MISLNVLRCRNPEYAWNIPLPLPKHPGTFPHQAGWPMDGVSRNFQCFQCKHVFEYKSSDVLPVSGGYRDQDLVRKYNNVVCVEVSCGKAGCAAPLQIHILIAHGQDMYEEARAALQQAILHDVPCQSGHATSGPLQAGSILSVRLDDNWERENT